MIFRREPPAPPAMVRPEDALPGRDTPIPVADSHLVLGRPMTPPWPQGMRLTVLAMGCFWGAERIFWSLPGVWTTFVGYAGGYTPNPTYEEVCSGRTGHAEVVAVVHDPEVLSFAEALVPFFEQHDPTQVMRQGNDIGTQYRSAILVDGDDDRQVAEVAISRYQQRLSAAGFGTIATRIEPLGPVYHAEPYHQQYLARNPGGYCNHGFCQIAYDAADAAPAH